MADISRVLFTAKEALLSNLTAINVTGSNIANVNTPGYSRLRPVFESVGAKDASSGLEQIGVKIADVQRIYDKYLESQMVTSQSLVGDYTAQKDLLQGIEGVLNESSDNGINDALTKFWNAWGDLSVDPSSKAKRDMVVSTAQNLASIFVQRSEDLTKIQNDTNDTVADTVNTLNGYLTEMASLNDLIVNAESAGANASSVRDKRDELLTKISGLIDVNYIEKSDGSLYIYLPTNGKALVEESNAWQLQVQRNPDNNNLYDIVFQEDPTEAINDEIAGGKLAGLLTVRDTALPSYLDQLNQTAASIVNKVNNQQMIGYDQNGNPGVAFFNPISEAKYMAVSDEIIEDSTKIAASSTVGADGDNATLMTALKNDQIYASLDTTLSTDAPPVASASILVPASLGVDDTIVLTRGATAANWTVTTHAGYPLMVVGTTADATTLTLDADGDGADDISLALSGTWESGDTATFSITAAGPSVSAVTTADSDSGASDDHYAAGQINNIGQAYKDTLTGHPITLTRGLTAAAADWTISDNGGYTSAKVLTANNSSVTLDLNGNGTADITFALSGSWSNGDTMAFSLTKRESTTTIDGYFNAFIANMGQDVLNASQSLETNTVIATQQSQQREELSGVSLDEEMMNLIKYQMAYSAAGRVSKTVSEMMDTIINLGR